MMPNLYALNIILVATYLILVSAYLMRRIIKPERIASETPRLVKDIERASKVRSKKKASIVGLKYRRLRGRVFRISMITATAPVLLMLLVLIYSLVLFGEAGLIAPSTCSLPPPIDIEINTGGRASCYTYTIWIIFFSYIMIMPLYNRIAGIDLIRRLRENE